MTRDQERAVWAIALTLYGVDVLEEKVHQHIEASHRDALTRGLLGHTSPGALAVLIGLLLNDIVSGSRPLLSGYRAMNREHFRVLHQLRQHLSDAVLSDLPASLLPQHLHRLKAQVDFAV
ncbi:hypothetical protein D9M69_452230 [compost metagenome]